MSLVTDAIDDMVERFSAEDLDFSVAWNKPDARRTTNMRFDAESPVQLDLVQAAQLLAKDMTEDFEELVVKGGGFGAQDALLSAFMGSEKTKKTLTLFSIQGAGIWAEYVEKRKMWQYTLYCVVYAEYDNEPAKIY